MDQAERARLVMIERKAFRAARPPAMPSFDAAGVSTKPWGARRMRGVGLSGSAGPSDTALDFWRGATGQRRRRRKSLFARIF